MRNVAELVRSRRPFLVVKKGRLIYERAGCWARAIYGNDFVQRYMYVHVISKGTPREAYTYIDVYY
jgi:hypothetical protein